MSSLSEHPTVQRFRETTLNGGLLKRQPCRSSRRCRSVAMRIREERVVLGFARSGQSSRAAPHIPLVQSEAKVAANADCDGRRLVARPTRAASPREGRTGPWVNNGLHDGDSARNLMESGADKYARGQSCGRF
jgi:hypothetical protein